MQRDDGCGAGGHGDRRGLRGAREPGAGRPRAAPSTPRSPTEDSPEALDGLGRALWWLRDAEQAVVAPRARVLGLPPRRRPGPRRADRALALARVRARLGERRGRERLARARRAAARRRRAGRGARAGSRSRARSGPRDPAAAARLAAPRARRRAARRGDVDLELRALAQLGLAEVSAGQIDEGLGRLDEAMAAATGGEAATLETFADVSCTLLLACERAGDGERPRQWAQVVRVVRAPLRPRRAARVLPQLLRRRPPGERAASTPPSRSSSQALRELTTPASARAACIPPRAWPRSASCRAGSRRPSSCSRGSRTSPRRSRPRSRSAWHAASPQRRARSWSSSSTGSGARTCSPRRCSPASSRPARGRRRRGRARDAADELAGDRASRRPDRAVALAALAAGRVAAACGRAGAPELLQRALNRVRARCRSRSRPRAPGSSWRAPRARVRTAGRDRPRAARACPTSRRSGRARGRRGGRAPARARREGADGAARPRAAQQARAARCCGCSARASRTRRSRERLFISPKTAEHHVGRIYGKLQLRTRTELAAYAVRNLGGE